MHPTFVKKKKKSNENCQHSINHPCRSVRDGPRFDKIVVWACIVIICSFQGCERQKRGKKKVDNNTPTIMKPFTSARSFSALNTMLRKVQLELKNSPIIILRFTVIYVTVTS